MVKRFMIALATAVPLVGPAAVDERRHLRCFVALCLRLR
jgi:hypothetical protein